MFAILLGLMCTRPMWCQTTNTFPASGNVGIGTMTPGANLSLGQGVANTKLALYDDGANLFGFGIQANNFRFHVYSAGADFNFYNAPAAATPLFTIKGSGNVGIGTAVPAYRLVVADSAGNSFEFAPGATANTNWLQGFNRITSTYNSLILNGASHMFYVSGIERMRVDSTGNVGIGTANPTSKLSVNGTIQAKEVIVNMGWADYVFSPTYRIEPLREVAAYIPHNHHLPEIPSEAEVKEKGVGIGDMQAKLLAKVEELTLYMIQADGRIERLEQQNRHLQEHDRENCGTKSLSQGKLGVQQQ